MANSDKTSVLGFMLSKKGGEIIQKLIGSSELLEGLGVESSIEQFEKRVMSIRPGIVIAEYQSGNESLGALLDNLRVNLPNTPIIALSNSSKSEDIITAMRQGVREYLIMDNDLARLFSETVLRLRPQDTIREIQGHVVGVMGSKGGVGTSNIATNLAWALSQVHGKRVALVDLDLLSGTQSFLLNLKPEHDFSDVASEFHRLDRILLESFLVETAPGLRVLSAPMDPFDAEAITGEHVLKVIDDLANSHTYVICDLGNSLEECTLAAMDRIEKILLILDPTFLGVKSAIRTASLSKRLGYDDEKILFVVNRSNSQKALKAADIYRLLESNTVVFLPFDCSTLDDAANTCRPVLQTSSKSAWAKKLLKLSEELMQSGSKTLDEIIEN